MIERVRAKNLEATEQCDTIWMVRQADDLFVWARNPNIKLELEISDETGSGGGKEGPREDRG